MSAPDPFELPDQTRRQFIVTATTLAGGLALGIGLPVTAEEARASAAALGGRFWSSEERNPNEINAWVVIDPDDSVTLRVAQAEMGQGTATGLAMLLAEELECDWQRVRFEFASPNRNAREQVYGHMFTVGSMGIRTNWQLVQQGGASARARLVAAAAQQWQVPPDECSAAASRVHHSGSGRSLRYGELARAAAEVRLDAEPGIKNSEEFRLVGQPLPRLDATIKSNGVAQFGIDTQLPGQVYAAIAMCPVFGGMLGAFDESRIAGHRGVLQVVPLADAVAVVADSFWRASRAVRDLVPGIQWDVGEAGGVDNEQLRTMYHSMLDGPMDTARDDGDARGELAMRNDVIEALYEVPLLAHATMEPLNATVQLKPDRVDVWMGTQVSDTYTAVAAEATGLKPEQVYIHCCYLGGGFGRRDFGDELKQAIAIAKAVGERPVQLIWTREDDMRHDRYRPQAVCRFRSALDPATGLPAAMHVQIALGSIMAAVGMPLQDGIDPMAIEGIADPVPYTKIPHWYCGQALKNTHVPVAFWRSVGGSHNGFFLDSFIDELAHAAGRDPIEYRLALTDRADVRAVLEKVRDESDWGKPMPPGSGRGVAVCDNHTSVTAMVAEVTVNQGQLKVDRVVAAIDSYRIVNPNLVAQQVEGGVLFGLTAALYGEVTVRNGAVEQGNFDDYPMIRMHEAPEVEVHFALTGGTDENGLPRWGGVGESPTATIAPAVANAVFAATGQRVRRLPLKFAQLGEELKT